LLKLSKLWKAQTHTEKHRPYQSSVKGSSTEAVVSCARHITSKLNHYFAQVVVIPHLLLTLPGQKKGFPMFTAEAAGLTIKYMV